MTPEDSKKKKQVSSKKKVIRKKKTTVPTLSADKLESTLHVEEVIKQAFQRFYDTALIKQSKVKDLEHLDNIVEEYLQAYMILGYDLNGEKVLIMHASNPHDRDALVEHLRTTLLGIVNKDDSR
jgi:hypothetical protein